MPDERICGLHTWSPPSVTHLPPAERGEMGLGLVRGFLGGLLLLQAIEVMA